MKKFLVIILILLFSNISYADLNLNYCDNIEKRSKKLNCLTKLKTKALKENSTEKAKIIPKGIISKSDWSFSMKIFLIAGSKSQAIEEVLAATKIDKKADNIILPKYFFE